MKKIKLLTPILGLTALASAMVPLASCSCKKEETTASTVPSDAFEVKDVTLKGFKEDYDFSKYTKIVIPSNVKVIDTNAFKGILTDNNKITEVVIPKTVETIRAGAFEDCNNVSVYDFSGFDVDSIHALTVESGAFGDLSSNGIYSYIKMNDNWTNVQKDALKLKLLNAGVPSYWMTEQTTGNAEVVDSMEQQCKGGVGVHNLKLTGHYDYRFQYYFSLSRVDGTKDVSVEEKDLVIDSDFKSLKLETKMIGLNEHELVDGDWVSYKLTLICTYDDETSNTEKVKWVQNFETFKLTYEKAYVKSIELNYKECTLTQKGETLQLIAKIDPSVASQEVTWKSSDPTIVSVSDEGLITANKSGNAVITATSVEKPDVSATCNVTATLPLSITWNLDSNIIIEDKPTKIVKGETLTVNYDVTFGMKANKSTASITVGGQSILTQPGVEFAAGRITIPGELVTGDVVITLDSTNIPTETKEQFICDVDWAKFEKFCTEYESGNMTRDDFVASFTVGEQKSITSDLELIGSKVKFNINGVEHIARIVDIDHDTITQGQQAGKKAALTFDLVTLVSKSDKSWVQTNWGSNELTNTNYLNSTLIKNLNGRGTATYKLLDKTVWQMLSDTSTGSPALVNVIKPVEKLISTHNGSEWVITSYEDKLFVPTLYEFNITSYGHKKEGTPYKYWINRENAARIKMDAGGTKQYYWVDTPFITTTSANSGVRAISPSGTDYPGLGAENELGINFAFCI